MVLIVREKYDIQIVAPVGLNLHDTMLVKTYIKNHIAEKIRDCISKYKTTHDDAPQVVRLASSDFESLKEAIQKETGESYIYASKLKIDGIPVKATCQSGRAKVVLDSNLDEEIEEDS